MEMGRQSVPQTAHPNQQALRLQFPTEPRFLRLNHEALSFPVERDADFHLCLHHFARSAACRVLARKAILPESPILEIQISSSIENSKSRQPAQRLAGGSAARHRQKQF